MFSTMSILFTLFIFVCSASAASVSFQNCLSANTINSNPLLLQFTPLHVQAFFNTTSPTNNLNVTIYGNVSGRTTVQELPPPNSPMWTNPNDTLGKIVDLSLENNKYTTLFARFNVLSYTPYGPGPLRFCNYSIHGKCPIAPAFFVNNTDLDRLPAFSVSNDMFSTYAFTSITATMTVESGDLRGSNIACITATITPDLGGYLKDVLRFLPLAILISVAVATIVSATLSPFGSGNVFRWTSNYGRDEDLLRLVTPGFGDCLQYIQFIILTGSLSLNYPGFYQPVVSRVGWSSLMFNESFVTGGNGTQVVVDGIYQYRPNTTYGLDTMSQLIGMQSPTDMWADMIIWLVVIVVAASILTQIGFAGRWLYRQVTNEPPEDFRSKNWPFTAGNIVRTTLNFFLLPLISISMFQLVIAGQGPNYSVALAAVVIAAVIAFSARLMYLFAHTRPRSFLFDDLLYVLMYGPLYNTYCDDAATFAMVPIFLNFLRGIAIGAVQPSGIAQLVLLAICEIVFVLTINAFRPFPTASSMNIYHTFFALIRLVTLLLSIAFVPSLDVGETSKGWIGYAILLIHACVLIFGFFLNAVQTLIEVAARVAGAGGRNDGAGLARGGLTRVFGMRQLSKRMPRRTEQAIRQSTASNTAMLETDLKSLQVGNEGSRSASGTSTMLHRQGKSNGNPGNMSPGGASNLSKRQANTRLSGTVLSGGIVGIKQVESKDPYYRPPRRNTMEPIAPERSRAKASILKVRPSQADEEAIEDDAGEGASTAPIPNNDELEDGAELTKTKTDYAIREVDFYYGVRGPALSSGTRKLKTGPADPTGPVSSATGWFKGLLGRKTKEKGKGFEVVRSSRAPPPGWVLRPAEGRGGITPEPYHDDFDSLEIQRHEIDTLAPADTGLEGESGGDSSDNESVIPKIQARPPSLPQIDALSAIELPSRIGSQASHVSKKGQRPRPGDIPPIPTIPRKSSRRTSQDIVLPGLTSFPQARLSTVAASPPTSPVQQRDRQVTSSASGRIPFSTFHASPSKNNHYGADSPTSSFIHVGDEDNQAPGARYEYDSRDERPSSVGFVQQHRASDNIHYSPNEVGRSAEVYMGSERR
jgi:Transient receptor potential (TRP) ion channel/ML-like domain